MSKSNSAETECTFITRVCSTADVYKLRSLIQALANFEKMPTGPEVSAEQLAMDLERGAVNALGTFARRQDESEEQIVGMALFYYAYSTWQGQYIHLEDLFVLEPFRRRRVADNLMRRLAQLAHEKGMKRIQWNVLNWNEDALRFYEKFDPINLTELEGWLQLRLTDKHIEKIANPQ